MERQTRITYRESTLQASRESGLPIEPVTGDADQEASRQATKSGDASRQLLPPSSPAAPRLSRPGVRANTIPVPRS
jgi:hypothetical protein